MAPADNLRKRKTAADGNIPSKRVPAKTPEEYDNSKEKRDAQGVDLEPNIWVVAWLALSFISFIVAIFYYKIDNRNHGPVAAYINQNYPFVDRALNNYTKKIPNHIFYFHTITTFFNLLYKNIQSKPTKQQSPPLKYINFLNHIIFHP